MATARPGDAIVRPARARVRTHWFKSERPRGPEEIAGAVAFVVWRIANQVLRNLRNADFEIEAGESYFEFLAEWLVFLVQVADRVAYERLGDARLAFTSVVANRLGETLADNRADLLGVEPGVDRKSAFIDRLNLRLDDYIEFGGDEFGRMRYLADHLTQIAGEQDRIWVHEQVMEIEAPQAALQLGGAMADLMGETPRRVRAGYEGGAE
jgi:hypothetical protein